MSAGNTNDKNRMSSFQEVEQKIPDVTGLEILKYFDFKVATGDIVVSKPTANGQHITALIIDPLTDNKQTVVTQKVAIRANSHFASIESSMNQRTRHQYAVVEAVTNDNPSDISGNAIASIQQVTTTITIVTTFAVDWSIGDWINIEGVLDNRLNYPNFVVATISIDRKTITGTVSGEATIPSLSVGPYASQGTATAISQLNGSTDGYGMRFSGTSATAIAYLSKFGDNETMQSGAFVGVQTVTSASSAPVFTSGATGQVDIKATSRFMVRCDPDGILFHDRAVDSSALSTVRNFRSGVKPGWQKDLYIRYRAVSPKSMTRPIAKIISIVKTGTTTATVTTDIPHGLSTTSYVTIKGIRDQTNFPNLTTATVVESTPTTTTFTIIIGGAVTATSYGGSVILTNGQVDQPGIIAQSVQSIARDSLGFVTLIGSAAWAGLNIGEYIKLHGGRDNATGADLGFDGNYEVVTLSTTTLIVKPIIDFKGQIQAPTGGVVTTTNAGGTVILMTTLRSHDTVMSEFQQNIVAVDGQGSQDLSKALPTVILNTPSVTQGTAAAISTTDGSGGWIIRPGIVGIADIASAAITSTATSASIVNDKGNSFQVNIAVTVVSGTTPTMDVRIEESIDGGTNWITLYEFQRITATGSYNTPILRCTGRNIRYVRTIAGTTPSFTMALTRVLLPFHNAEPQKRLFDRTINVNTIDTTTAILFSGASNNVQLIVNMGAITTTAPQFQLEGSEDGVNFYSIGAPLLAVASKTVALKVSESVTYYRARTSTAGSGATLGYISLKSFS